MKLSIRAKARADLDAILDFSVHEHGKTAAESYIEAIGAALDRLREHPALGVTRSNLGDGRRNYPVGRHRVYYRVFADRLSIVRILHKAMDARHHI